MRKNRKESVKNKSGKEIEERCCGLPIVPIRVLDATLSIDRASLIRHIEKKWANHTVLHFHFLTTNPSWTARKAQKQAVRDAFEEWKSLGIGLMFVEVANRADAEIRIGFEPGSSWSYIGRDSIDLVPDINKRTMTFGWDLTTSYGHDTALHEIGHALGFPHEHQNPNAGIVWDEEAVYAYFGGPPNNWSRDSTYHNVIRKISPFEVEGSLWDRNSIMHYRFNSGLIIVPRKYQTVALNPDPGLSTIDIREVRKFYPGYTKKKDIELKQFASQSMGISAGEQLNFTIKPTVSRNYTIQTFGDNDTVMVLFEDIDGQPVYLSGDDDSGKALNALIRYRLMRGRTYYLRLRLYYEKAEGQGAVMLW